MAQAVSATTYALLGLLAIRSWTGYELTQQLRRSLHFVWPSSEGHLYREQKRLIELGWASMSREPVGRRQRNRYTITDAGRAALGEWLRTEPGPPRLEIEGLVRMFYGDQGDIDDMLRSMEATRDQTRSMLDELVGFADEYLEQGGPLEMLETGNATAESQTPRAFHGRPQFPERLPVVALVLDVTTTLLADLDIALAAAAEDVRTWSSTTDDRSVTATRARLERIRQRRPRTSAGR
jgi:DNA-binding PadR family transcriptional regulator